MPAKTPRARDHDRISARICASVSADALRPRGPAAADASPPIVNWLDSSLSTPLGFITSMMTSVSVPPTWKPTLPPSTRTPPGADQPPDARRHDRKPRLYLPPTMNAPFFMPGTTTTHSAFLNRSRGMPASGCSAISWRTTAAALSRLYWAATSAGTINAHHRHDQRATNHHGHLDPPSQPEPRSRQRHGTGPPLDRVPCQLPPRDPAAD